MRWMRVLCALSVAVAMAATSACSSLPAVQAWDKDVLAKPEMSFESDRLDAAFTQHTYFSKEAASGGAGVGGGGCGCN